MATAAATAVRAAVATQATAAAAAETLAGPWDFVILGGGNAGGYAARELEKQLGENVKGRVLLITEEPVMPYERPALTKAYLHPPDAKVRARLPGFHTSVGGGGERQDMQWYEDKGVSVRSGTQVAKVDAKQKTLTLQGGEQVKYGTLFFCTGARPLTLADIGIKDQPSSGVYYIRSEADAASLVSAFEGLQKASETKKEKGKVVLVGGGFIGLETAAAAAGWGFEPTVVLLEDAPLARVFPKPYSKVFQKRYEDAGIKFEFASSVSSFTQASDGSLSGVVLKDGKTLPADLAVIGVGARPNVELLSGQVEEKDRGILVDHQMRTSDKSIYAFGDVATFPLGEGFKRTEHVAHARSSATHAVQAATGANPGPYDIVPYFYSRVFEYTDKPLAFFLWGEQKGEHALFDYPGGSHGQVWVDNGKVSGALVFGSPTPPQSDMDLAQGAVAEKKTVKSASDAAALLGPRKEA